MILGVVLRRAELDSVIVVGPFQLRTFNEPIFLKHLKLLSALWIFPKPGVLYLPALTCCFFVLFVCFSGRMRALQRNKLTKKTLDLAQQYFLPPYSFQIRVGALYLLYGLYNAQLCQPKQKVIVPEGLFSGYMRHKMCDTLLSALSS